MSKTIVQKNPFIVPTTDGKLIAEHFGKATDGSAAISIAQMIAPPFWSEPFQTPEFDEFTLVISGKKQFIVDGETIVLAKGESIKILKNTNSI
jgi:quercetin dioxygenase-like cupin family protein